MYTPVVLVMVMFLTTHFISGCSPSISSSTATASLGDVTSIDIIIHDNYYGQEDNNLVDPPIWTVPSGADVVAFVNNLGDRTHNWAIVSKGASIPLPFNEGQSSGLLEYGAGMVYGMNRTTITFTAPEEVGEYMVICTVPGHFPSMQGRLYVE